MIRFIEMKGIYTNDDLKSFGFYDTTKNIFINLGGLYTFRTVKELEESYDEDCGVDFDRMKNLIPSTWHDYERSLLITNFNLFRNDVLKKISETMGVPLDLLLGGHEKTECFSRQNYLEYEAKMQKMREEIQNKFNL